MGTTAVIIWYLRSKKVKLSIIDQFVCLPTSYNINGQARHVTSMVRLEMHAKFWSEIPQRNGDTWKWRRWKNHISTDIKETPLDEGTGFILVRVSSNGGLLWRERCWTWGSTTDGNFATCQSTVKKGRKRLVMQLIITASGQETAHTEVVSASPQR
jgi:hypothetical protein